MMPFHEYYAMLEKSCETLSRPHDDDPQRLISDLLAAGITPVLARGKIDLEGIEHVRLTPGALQRIIANWAGIYAHLVNQALNTSQRSLFPREEP